VEDEAAAGGGAGQRSGVAKVASDSFDIQVGNGARGANEGADLVAALQKQAGDMPADEARSAGDESRFHAMERRIARETFYGHTRCVACGKRAAGFGSDFS